MEGKDFMKENFKEAITRVRVSPDHLPQPGRPLPSGKRSRFPSWLLEYDIARKSQM